LRSSSRWGRAHRGGQIQQTAPHDPYAALRYPEYRDFVASSFLFTIALLIQEVALGYELYTITHDPLALGLSGLVQAVPFIGLSLFGGYVADRRSKRTIILWSLGVITAGSVGLYVVAHGALAGWVSMTALIVAIYGTIFVIGLARAFLSPASSALRAFLVPIAVYENAATWSSSAWQAGAILGPAVGGFLFAWIGFANTLLVVACLLLCSLLLYTRIGEKPIPGGGQRKFGQSLREGVTFVWRTKPVLYAISLDLFSVLFGGVVAILPIYAQDILRVGSEGLGILRAAPSAGAVITLLVMSHIPPMRHAWRNLLIAVTGFGVSILVFALSPWMALSAGALFFSGAFDSISIVIRQTLLQVRTPDAMRGQVMSVNGIFISSSNELGAFESGVAASVMGVVPSAVFGGVMTLLIVGWVSLRTKDLLKAKLDEGQ
jgi:predicted MFS family arabinose efflux permease